jgi:hypothetical protein
VREDNGDIHNRNQHIAIVERQYIALDKRYSANHDLLEGLRHEYDLDVFESLTPVLMVLLIENMCIINQRQYEK